MKDIRGYEGRYAVTEQGNVWSYRSNKFLKKVTMARGYQIVCLSKEGVAKNYYVHRLVAEAFIERESNDLEVNHKDEDKTNNNVSNLEWVSRKENVNYGSRTKRAAENTRKPVRCIETGVEFNSVCEAAESCGMSQSYLSNHLAGRNRLFAGYHWEYI